MIWFQPSTRRDALISWLITVALAAATWWPAIGCYVESHAHVRGEPGYSDKAGLGYFILCFYLAPLTFLVSMYFLSNKHTGLVQSVAINLPLLLFVGMCFRQDVLHR